MARRDPTDAALGIGEDIGKALGRDAEYPSRLISWIREVVQAVRAFREVNDISGRELLLTVWGSDGRRACEHEEHLLHAVVHMQWASGCAWQKLCQRRTEHVGLERVPEPPDAPVVLQFIP